MVKDMNRLYVGYTFENMKHLSSEISLCKVQGKSELLKKEEKSFVFFIAQNDTSSNFMLTFSSSLLWTRQY